VSELADRGADRIEWARSRMPVLGAIAEEMKAQGSLKDVRLGMAMHVEAKTGVLALALRDAGATVRLASCNPLSTDDSVAIALQERFGLETYAQRGQTNEAYYESLNHVLDVKPDVVVDDGADLIQILHTSRTELLDAVRGGNEETTTGVNRLRAMAKDGALKFPVFSVNDAQMKHLFDNRYGTGQSTLDGIMTATNLVLAGRSFVVAGYGWCGRGLAMRAKGMGAQVIVTEVNPVRAVEARMDGFRVMRMVDAIAEADFVVTATGGKDVVAAEAIARAKDGCVLANTGHFNVEISLGDLEAASTGHRRARESVEEYTLRDGRKLYLLAEGRLVNLAVGQGHPVEIMDMSFGIQALCAREIVERGRDMQPGVYDVPAAVDDRVAHLALEAMGVSLDLLTDEQKAYLGGWSEGT
jgi:adenosylhomocysteinase